MQNLKTGDVVRLKSGGPLMTVKEIGEYSEGEGALCQWFSGEDTKMDVFPPDSLRKEEEEARVGPA